MKKTGRASAAMIARAKRTALGRTLCRLFGDDSGGVMMEYVILAVLIAAACVVAVAMFGKTIVGMFSVAAINTTGEHTTGAQVLDKVQQTTQDESKEAVKYHESMHK